jgi:GNAT superfamily N-acetyltransferase
VISIRPAAAHEWPIYRDTRLSALRDAPDAFGSSFAAEATRTDEAWAARVAAAAASQNDQLFLAFDQEQPCGLIWCKRSAAEPAVTDLYQMWVAPGSRAKGTGQALLQAALDWARAAGTQRARLGVTAADSPAMRLYRRHGFRAAGPLEPLREGASLMAQTMELPLN